jgi:MFS family permease
MAATCLGSMLAGRVATRLGTRATLIASLAVAAVGTLTDGGAVTSR